MRTWLAYFVKILRRSPVFRFLVLGIVVLVGFWAARLYLVDMPKRDRAKIASSGKEILSVLAQNMSRDADTLPVLTQWYPTDLPCGLEGTFSVDPFWQGLGLKVDTKSHYQYRFHRVDEKYTLMARRDSDCDGLFVVHRMDGSIGSVGNVTTNNVGE